mmetsp:Transcript_14153/g.23666  ORF Transcript_14153/g.23666 Transcript_14153/m.23666 type:complete len:191 (-) Transcript_14153:332-904(-)
MEPSSDEQQQRQIIDEATPTQTTTNATTKINKQIQQSNPGVPPQGAQYEYLNHPADIILHSWGTDLPSSLCNIALCMFGYITSLESISTNEAESNEHGSHMVAEGHDMRSLVYSFLDEWLYNFHAFDFVANAITIEEINLDKWTVVSSGKGEVMDISRHPQGMEVKAITYSGMRIDEKEGRVDIYVVVDI